MSALILASGSSRRRELLDQIGVQYHCAAMDIDESVLLNESAHDYVRRLAQEKAQAALGAYPNKVILAADTTVVLADKILGKPSNKQDAHQTLRHLSGHKHQVLTGIAVAQNYQGKLELVAQVVSTEVEFCDLSDEQISAYIETGEPMDKAGAYGIQGKGALFVASIHGSYSNVVGLPLAETGKLLQEFGIPVWQDK